MSHLNPWGEPRPCTGCQHCHGLLYGQAAADCRLDGHQVVHAMWRTGCAFWTARTAPPPTTAPSPAQVRVLHRQT